MPTIWKVVLEAAQGEEKHQHPNPGKDQPELHVSTDTQPMDELYDRDGDDKQDEQQRFRHKLQLPVPQPIVHSHVETQDGEQDGRHIGEIVAEPRYG